jgi:MOSC domain-containing protein YiiM
VTTGTLESIVHQPKDRAYEEGRFADFIRVPVDSIRVLEDVGLEDDQKARGGSKRQVNVLSREWLDGMAPLGYRTAPGEFGEQLVVRGFRVEELLPGDRFRVGDEVVLEVTMPRHGCTRLQAAQGGRVAADVSDHVGMLTRVVAGGTIRVGDPVASVVAAEHAG